jgi:hypothetical protein
MTDGIATPPSLSLTPAQAQALRTDDQAASRGKVSTNCGSWQVYTQEEARRRLERRGSWTIPSFPPNSRP